MGEVYVTTKSLMKTMHDSIGMHDAAYTLNDIGVFFSGGKEWCSEYVSWVYFKSGQRFDKGSFTSSLEQRRWDTMDSGEWMQRSVTRIINWFKVNEGIGNVAYINRSDERWWSLKPKLGDYVYIGRAAYHSESSFTTRRHSGLVEYLGEDGTLHTIEGNNGGRPVMRFQYPHYKINTTDNGMANGVVMGIGVR